MSNRLLYPQNALLALCSPEDWIQQRQKDARRGDAASVDASDKSPLTPEEFASLPELARLAAVDGDPENKFNGDRNRVQWAASCAIEREGKGELHYRYLLDGVNCPWIAAAIARTSDGKPRPNHEGYACKQVAKARAEVAAERAETRQLTTEVRSRLCPMKLAPFKKGDLQATPWVVKGLLLRGAVSTVAAAGGTGKTQLTIQAAVAWAEGQAFAAWMPMRRLRVLFVSGEEPVDELKRRVAAAVLECGDDFDQTMEQLDGWLFTVATKDVALVAKTGEDGKVVRTQFHKELVQFAVDNNIDVVIVDPTIRAHSGLDENSAEMQELHNAADEIATKANCAVMLVHHIRKSSRGNVDDQSGVRGASALVDASRVTVILANMTPEEGKELLPVHEQPHYANYVKYKDPKQNYGPTSPVRWFQKVGVRLPVLLEDGSDDYRMVLRPWSPAQNGDVVKAPWLDKFLDAIERGPGDGEMYSAATSGPRAQRADALLKSYGVSNKQTETALRKLVGVGILTRERRRSPKSKREVEVYAVNSRVPTKSPDDEIPF